MYCFDRPDFYCLFPAVRPEFCMTCPSIRMPDGMSTFRSQVFQLSTRERVSGPYNVYAGMTWGFVRMMLYPLVPV